MKTKQKTLSKRAQTDEKDIHGIPVSSRGIVSCDPPPYADAFGYFPMSITHLLVKNKIKYYMQEKKRKNTKAKLGKEEKKLSWKRETDLALAFKWSYHVVYMGRATLQTLSCFQKVQERDEALLWSIPEQNKNEKTSDGGKLQVEKKTYTKYIQDWSKERRATSRSQHPWSECHLLCTKGQNMAWMFIGKQEHLYNRGWWRRRVTYQIHTRVSSVHILHSKSVQAET